MQMTINYRVVLGIVGAALALASVFVFGWVTPVDAAGPKDGLETEELNVDEDGHIAVHEQGVADVNIVGGDATVTIDDTSPVAVNVTSMPTVSLDEESLALLTEIRDSIQVGPPAAVPTPATEFRRHSFDLGPFDSFGDATFAPLLVTHVIITTEDDEASFFFKNNGSDIFFLGAGDDDFPGVLSIPFTNPVEIDEYGVLCRNEVEGCEFDVMLIGLSVSG